MSIALTSPVTGAAQTGFTAPTYTIAAATAPDVNGKQYTVSALGGTQAGVTVHSVSSPFTLSFWVPKILRAVGLPNNAGWLVNNPTNVYKFITRKGLLPLANERAQVGSCNTAISIPAGADNYDIANVRAMISAHIGSLSQLSAGLGDTANSGTM